MSEEAKKTAPAQEAEQPETAPEEKAQQAAPEQEPAAEAADPKDDKKKDGGWFNKKARELEAVKAKLDAAEANAAQAKDQLLRMAAEYENYRKRSTREADQKFNDGISFAVNQLLIKGAADRAAKKREKEDEQRRERYILQMDSRKATFDLLSCICAGIERMETETGQIYWNGELKRCLSHLEGVDERYRESDQRQLAELNTRNK